MKTIVEKETNISVCYLADSKDVDITDTNTIISEGGTPKLIIPDLNSSNAILRTGVDAVSNYWAWKYKHDGSSWSANTDFKGGIELTANINNSVTTIPVANTDPFTSSGTVQIEDEKITYTGVDGTNLTGCTRGAESTSAASYEVDKFTVSVTQV